MASSTMMAHPTEPPIFTHLSPMSCPSCGFNLPPPSTTNDTSSTPEEAHLRILDLENQVRVLNTKAAAAADRLADYEDEVRYLRETYGRSQPQGSPTPDGLSPSFHPGGPQQQAAQQSRLSSLSALLPGRRREVNATPNTAAGGGGLPPTPTTATFSTSPQNLSPQHHNNRPPLTETYSSPDLPLNPNTQTFEPTQPQTITLTSLQTSLETERNLRLRAETNLTQTQHELEELTAQLFGQANEMVATERKARAKLEERVKVLEDRDLEKRKRLDRLERALERIERVRGMVG